MEDVNEIMEMDYGIDFIEYLSIRVIMYNKVEKEIFNFDFVNLV